jgi:hypothetical protein
MGLVVISESKEYDRRRSAFDISNFLIIGVRFPRRAYKSLLLTYPGLPYLRKNVAQTLYPGVNGFRVDIEPVDGLCGLFGIEIEVGMKHVEIERRSSRRET